MANKTIGFDAASPVPSNGYRLRYRPQGSSGAYTVVNTTSTTVNLTGLTDNIVYEYILDSNCGAGVFSSDNRSGTFNTYPVIDGKIYITAEHGPGHVVTLHVELTNPLTVPLEFRWGFCTHYSGVCDFPEQDKCESDPTDSSWPVASLTVGTTNFTDINQTAGWNADCMVVTEVHLWDITNNVVLNLNTNPYNQTLRIL